jgi:hypothetical protein
MSNLSYKATLSVLATVALLSWSASCQETRRPRTSHGKVVTRFVYDGHVFLQFGDDNAQAAVHEPNCLLQDFARVEQFRTLDPSLVTYPVFSPTPSP